MTSTLPLEVSETIKKADEFLSQKPDAALPVPIEDLKILVNDLIKCIYTVANEPGDEKMGSSSQKHSIRGKISVDENGIIVKADSRIASILGIEQCRLVKRKMQSLIDRPDKKLFNQLRLAVFENGIEQACRLKLIHTDGRNIEVQLSLKPKFSQSGECKTVDTSIHLQPEN